MKATLKDGKLTIEIEASENPTVRSASGKTLMVASTHGNQPTAVMIQGKPLIVSVNAYIK